MLRVDNISLYYGAAQALRGVSISAEPGRVTCVLGRNGVGKTSLLDALMGQHPVSSGSIVWEGNDITALRPATITAWSSFRMKFISEAVYARKGCLPVVVLRSTTTGQEKGYSVMLEVSKVRPSLRPAICIRSI